MKKIKYLLLAFVILFLMPQMLTDAYAHNPGMYMEYTSISTSDGGELEIAYDAGNSWSSGSNSIEIVGNGYCISIRYSPGMSDWITLEIANSDSPWWSGEGFINMRTSFGWGEYTEVIDTSGLTPEYLDLWTTFQVACGELLENEEFWVLFKDEDDEMLEALQEKMEFLRDGYIAPSTYRQDLNVSFSVNAWNSDNRLARGYHVRGPGNMYLMTPSAIGDENPEIYITLKQSYADDVCVVHINPLDSVCLAYWETNTMDAPDPMLQGEWVPFVEEITATLEFLTAQAPYLIEYGMIDADDEYVFLLEKGLEGLSEFPIEARIFSSED